MEPSEAQGQLGAQQPIRVRRFQLERFCPRAGWPWHPYFHGQWHLHAQDSPRGLAQRAARSRIGSLVDWETPHRRAGRVCRTIHYHFGTLGFRASRFGSLGFHAVGLGFWALGFSGLEHQGSRDQMASSLAGGWGGAVRGASSPPPLFALIAGLKPEGRPGFDLFFLVCEAKLDHGFGMEKSV